VDPKAAAAGLNTRQIDENQVFTLAAARPGLLTGVFCFGYGMARVVGEIFREPDSFLGFILGTGWLTMGMVLSLPVLLFGLALILRARRAAPLPA